VADETLTSEVLLPRRREEVFPFFADARNLERITPPWLRFRILTPGPIEMREGALIDYRLRIRGVPVRWRTRIAAWEPPYRFVDEQVRGPYRRWVHEHTFEATDGGTLCRDRVRYAVPGGALVARALVRPDVERIFAYRRDVLTALFPHVRE
jgi:ligand-binding SRPBCC domain-containing protein